MSAARVYLPYEKHKEPKGWGSLCPHPFPGDVAADLLSRAVQVAEGKLWSATGRWCFCAHPTRLELNTWHGFPVIGGEVPHTVLKLLVASGAISEAERRRLSKQRELPAEWP